MRPDSRLFVFETNDNFAELLNRIDDDRLTVLHDSVEDILELIPKDIIGTVDHVVSGIPFSFFEWDMKMSILSKTKQVLRKDGSFLAYQTSGHLKEPSPKPLAITPPNSAGRISRLILFTRRLIVDL